VERRPAGISIVDLDLADLHSRRRHQGWCLASRVAVARLSTHARTHSLLQLYTLYSDTNPPPAVFLRHPVLLGTSEIQHSPVSCCMAGAPSDSALVCGADVMVKALFTPSKEPNQRYLDKYIFLLAYAASVKDERTMDATPNESADAVGIDKSRLASTTEALHQVYEICHANTNGNELSTSVAVLETNLSYPVVAMALLHWISTNLLDPGFYTSSYYVLRSPILIHLLRLVQPHFLPSRALVIIIQLILTSFSHAIVCSNPNKRSLNGTRCSMRPCSCC